MTFSLHIPAISTMRLRAFLWSSSALLIAFPLLQSTLTVAVWAAAGVTPNTDKNNKQPATKINDQPVPGLLRIIFLPVHRFFDHTRFSKVLSLGRPALG